jgi:hypothetical protein
MRNKEVQRFANQKWLVALFLGVHLLQIYSLSSSLYSYMIHEETLFSKGGLLVFWLGFLVFSIVFFNLKLTTQFIESRIVVSYWPFLWRPFEISKEQIKTIEIRTYKPLLEFGGWGYRVGWSGFTAYSTHGKTGVFIEFKHGKKIMIGTQKPDIWKKWIQENYAGN